MKSIIKITIIICLSLYTGFAQKATVKEMRKVFRTYNYFDPSPVVKMNNIYPYNRFDGYSVKAENREWKVIELENPYIKIFIMPEIGGKIWGAIDKTTGREFIYFNKVVKFRDIAMRGPWTSGGIEFNFGDIGHAPSTSSLVDYFIRENEDGSASCFIGSMDLPSRTEWQVEIRLHADKAYFETYSKWYNPTEVNTSLYNWSNAAIEASNDLQLFYPGTNYIDHDGNLYQYPINEKGIDISIYGNNNFGSYKSYHVLGTYTDYFGAIWKNLKFGFVHYSPYIEKPGKKIWIWGLSREGEIWVDLLTDPNLGNKQYVEVQSGLLFNQAAAGSAKTPFKHAYLSPNCMIEFSEFWYPINGLDNIVEANEYGALSVFEYNNKLIFGLSAAVNISSDLCIKKSGKEIYRKNIKLKPAQFFIDSLLLDKTENYEIILGDKLIYYNSEKSKIIQRPKESPKDFYWNSVYGLYLAANERAKQRDLSGALSKYLECLEKDSYYLPALNGISEIYFKQMELSKALEYIKKSLSIDAYDPSANYLYGIINKKLGNLYDAKDGFGFAARSKEFASSAYLKLGEISFTEMEYNKSIYYAFKSLEYDKNNINALMLFYLNLRKQNKKVEAEKYLNANFEPLNHFAGFEKYLLERKADKIKEFKDMIRNEFPYQTFLELGIYYYNLGLIDDAILLFENSPENSLVYYWLAFLYDKKSDQQKSLAFLEKAISADPKFIFPFREETAAALEWAKAKDKGWKTKYYLALIYWSRNRRFEAEKLLKECAELPDYFPFYMTRANFYKSELSKNSEQIYFDYKRALELNKEDWRIYHALNDFLLETGKYERALSLSKDAIKKFSGNNITLLDYAKALLLNNKFKECISVLEEINVLPYEGSREGRNIYWLANIVFAIENLKKANYKKCIELTLKAEQWPENLGSGKPYEIDNRFENFIRFLCYNKLNENDKSESAFKEIIKIDESENNYPSFNRVFRVIALDIKNSKSSAKTIINKIVEKDPENQVLKWVQYKINNDVQSAESILKNLETSNQNVIWLRYKADIIFNLLIEILKPD